MIALWFFMMRRMGGGGSGGGLSLHEPHGERGAIIRRRGKGSPASAAVAGGRLLRRSDSDLHRHVEPLSRGRPGALAAAGAGCRIASSLPGDVPEAHRLPSGATRGYPGAVGRKWS